MPSVAVHKSGGNARDLAAAHWQASSSTAAPCVFHADLCACIAGILWLVRGRLWARVWLMPWLCSVQGSRALACLGPAAAQVCLAAALTGALICWGTAAARVRRAATLAQL